MTTLNMTPPRTYRARTAAWVRRVGSSTGLTSISWPCRLPGVWMTSAPMPAPMLSTTVPCPDGAERVVVVRADAHVLVRHRGC